MVHEWWIVDCSHERSHHAGVYKPTNQLTIFVTVVIVTVLSGDRASQMTRTFDDPEAISRLLEEKEKDLELTVQIGKELLQQNSQLESRISDLESELKAATENISQLTHDLQQKNELINVLTNDLDDGSESGKISCSNHIHPWWVTHHRKSNRRVFNSQEHH